MTQNGPTPREPLVPVVLKVERSVRHALKQIALDKDTTVSDLLRIAIARVIADARGPRRAQTLTPVVEGDEDADS